MSEGNRGQIAAPPYRWEVEGDTLAGTEVRAATEQEIEYIGGPVAT